MDEPKEHSDRCQKEKSKDNTNKREVHALTGDAAGTRRVAYPWHGPHLSLMREGKAALRKGRRGCKGEDVQIMFCCLCVGGLFPLPQLLEGVCLSPRGSSPGPGSAAELCPLSTFTGCG